MPHFHIQINGRTLCDHTGCEAGREDVRKAEKLLGGNIACGYSSSEIAIKARMALVEAMPHAQIVVKPWLCPRAAGL